MDADASNNMVGAVLSQVTDGAEHLIYFHSWGFEGCGASILCDRTGGAGSSGGCGKIPTLYIGQNQCGKDRSHPNYGPSTEA